MDSCSKKIFLYDTTLRDGTQSEDVNFTVIDKIRIAERLIEFGIDCIEGGWPGSNPRDMEFFNALKQNSNIDINKISAFGSTRRAKKTCETDEIIQSLLEAEVPNITIFGKTWDLHVKEALKISLEENITIIHDTVRYLKSKVDKVYYDAEHFFDGYIANPEYAINTLLAARDAGADCVVLCETNGGAMPDKVAEIVEQHGNGLLYRACRMGGNAVAFFGIAVYQGVQQLERRVILADSYRVGHSVRCDSFTFTQLQPQFFKGGLQEREVRTHVLGQKIDSFRFYGRARCFCKVFDE